MPHAVAFELDDNTTVVVAPTTKLGDMPTGLGARLETAEQTLRHALEPVTKAAAQILDDFRKLAHHPHEVEIAFGVVLDGRLGGIIASANAGAHIDVTLHWRQPADG
jgi:hypothetical protein